MTPLQALEMLAQFIIEKDDNTDFSASVIEAHNEIKKALTPPTADEVCEAIEEEIDKEVFYDKEHQKFYSWYGDDECIYCRLAWEGAKEYVIESCFSPKVIIIIGRFYEAQL